MKKNKKVLILLGIMLIVLAGCTQYIDPNTKKVMPEKIIGLSTAWGSTNDIWFGNFFVWPLAQLLNFFEQYVGAFWSITVVTLLITMLTLRSTMKSTAQQAKIQEIQPELNRIQEKYKNMSDNKNARMMMAQDQQKVYEKHGIKLTAGMGGLLLQLPIMIAMYQAVGRAEGIIGGTVLGQPLEITPLQGIQSMNIVIIVIYVLMIIAQAASTFLPQYFAKKKAKKRPGQQKPAGPNMNTMLFVSIGMIVYLALQWPLGMSLYWMISALARVVQTVYVNFVSEKK